MSSDRAALVRALAAFDDAALETLASRGLLRRALRDVAAGKVALHGVDETGAQVHADGEQVRIDAAGPGSATCTCRSASVCRHRLAATLVLRAEAKAATMAATSDLPEQPGTDEIQPPVPPAATPITGDNPTGDDTGGGDSDSNDADDNSGGDSGDVVSANASDSAEQALRETLALSRTALARWAGKAAMRAAEELLDTVAEPHVETQGQSLVVQLGEPHPAVRILPGAGLDGIVSKAARARRKMLHAAAVLVVRRAHLDAPDDAPLESIETAIAGPDPEFLAEVRACLGQCLRTGFNQAPVALEERLFAMSVSSRADHLPRLASLLRTLAARVRARRERDFSLDVEAYLGLLAETYALVHAVQQPRIVGAPERLATLSGQVRREYRVLDDLELYAAGADLWHTATGARGVTSYLYSPTLARWFNVSVARPNGRDVSFDPLQAYTRETLWGTASLARLENAQLRLRHAGAAADGRLSLARTVTASTAAWTPDLAAVGAWPCCFDDFEALEQHLRYTFGSGLSSAHSRRTPVLLAPAQWALPYFDELSQSTVWPVSDGHRWLALVLRGHAQSSRQVEAAAELAGVHQTHVVAALAAPVGQHFELTPFAAWVGDPATSIVSLGMSEIPAAQSKRSWAGQALRRIARGAVSSLGLVQSRFEPARVDDLTSRALTDCLDALLGVAEVGFSDGCTARFTELAARFRRLELTPLADVCARVSGMSHRGSHDTVLAAVYVTTTARALRRRNPWLVPT